MFLRSTRNAKCGVYSFLNSILIKCISKFRILILSAPCILREHLTSVGPCRQTTTLDRCDTIIDQKSLTVFVVGVWARMNTGQLRPSSCGSEKMCYKFMAKQRSLQV